jgi:DNA-binding transcriptional LysR family regulator
VNSRELSVLDLETEVSVELTDLLTFSAVARNGGITRAAEELNTVQSNVTQRVKALEAEIGTALFERHSRGMTLTGAGRRLLPYAQRMATLSREAVLAARDDGEPKGPLAIGSMETTAAVRLPMLLAEFHRRFPAVLLTLKTATTADLVAAVLDGAVDGAFVAGPIEHADLAATLAFREELVLVSAKRFNNLAALRAGTPESGPTALVFRTGCTYRQRLEQVFSDFGWPSAARFELGTLDGMIGCVAAGMGVTLLPRAVVERSDQRKEVNIHAIDTSWSRVDTLFIQRRSAHLYSALSGFVSCLTGAESVIAA